MNAKCGLALALLGTGALVASARLSHGDTCPPPQPTTQCDGTWRKHQLGIANIGTNCTIRWICVPNSVSGDKHPNAEGPTTGTVKPSGPPVQR